MNPDGFSHQCRRRDSNPHALYGQRILNPSRLPIPPLRPWRGDRGLRPIIAGREAVLGTLTPEFHAERHQPGCGTRSNRGGHPLPLPRGLQRNLAVTRPNHHPECLRPQISLSADPLHSAADVPACMRATYPTDHRPPCRRHTFFIHPFALDSVITRALRCRHTTVSSKPATRPFRRASARSSAT